MYTSMCLYIIITIMLWVLSIYTFIKHYTIVILCYPYNLVMSPQDYQKSCRMCWPNYQYMI